MSRKNKMSNAEKLNWITYKQYVEKFTALAMSVFKWENLPPTINEQYLERKLFYEGKILFFQDDILGHLTLPFAGEQLDIYGEPVYRRAYAPTGYSRVLGESDSVIIYNNYLKTPSVEMIDMYALRIAEIERTIDVNVIAQKTPVIIQSSEQQRLTMINLMQNYSGNEPFIYGDNSLDMKGINVFQLNPPFVADKLQVLKTQIKNELLTDLGITNGSFNKRERMLSAEVELNTGDINAQKYTRLGMRELACERINEMFQLEKEVKVGYREDVLEKILETKDSEELGVEE